MKRSRRGSNLQPSAPVADIGERVETRTGVASPAIAMPFALAGVAGILARQARRTAGLTA
jgi:hypothetical protein